MVGDNGPGIVPAFPKKGLSMISFNTPNRRFLITSHGNGWAYEITDQETGHSLWFQDADAESIRDYTQDFENESSIDDYFAVLD